MKINKVRTSACEQCPFAKSTSKKYLDTRGQNGHRFIAQTNMQALLPCHMDDPDGIADPDGKNRQCYGAAVFRTHIDADIKTDALPKLPADPAIFETVEELFAHHTGLTVEEAKTFFEENYDIAGKWEDYEKMLMMLRDRGWVEVYYKMLEVYRWDADYYVDEIKGRRP